MSAKVMITGQKPDGKFEVISGPSVDYGLKKEYKTLIAGDGNGFSEISFWDSRSGITARKKFAEAVSLYRRRGRPRKE